MEDCAELSSHEVNRIFQVELHSILDGQDTSAPASCPVKVTCRRSVVDLELTEKASESRKVRRLFFDPEPCMSSGETDCFGRERLIAIAAAEMVFSCLTPVPETAALPPAPRPAVPEVSAPKMSAAELVTAAIRLSALGQTYFNDGAPLFGGSIGGMLFLKRRPALGLDIGAGGGRVHFSSGDVSLLNVYAAPSVGIAGFLQSRPLSGGMAVGFRAAYGRLSGRSDSSSVETAVIHGGCGGPFFRLFGAAGRRFGAGITVDLGYDVYGTIGIVPNGDAIRLKGLRLSVQLDLLFFMRRRGDS